MIVVADTGPVNYLILSDHVELVHQLYGSLLIPRAVHRELVDPRAPDAVRLWTTTLPPWVTVITPRDTTLFPDLGPGEREAIALAIEKNADFVLMDETLGRRAAVSESVTVKGTVGVLEDGARRRLIELPKAIERLKTTGIFLADDVIQQALERDRRRRT